MVFVSNSSRAQYTYIVHVERLVSHSQVAVRGSLAASVVNLLADGQLLFVVLDSLNNESKGELFYYEI